MGFENPAPKFLIIESMVGSIVPCTFWCCYAAQRRTRRPSLTSEYKAARAAPPGSDSEDDPISENCDVDDPKQTLNNDTVEDKVDDIMPALYLGNWQSNSGLHMITDSSISWQNCDVSQIQRKSEESFVAFLDGVGQFHARLVPGSRLVWSNGSVWTRPAKGDSKRVLLRTLGGEQEPLMMDFH